MKKVFMISLIVLFTFGLITGGVAAPKPKGTIKFAVPEFGYESMDPIFYESFWGWAMYDSLLTIDAKGNVVSEVAKSCTLSPDGKAWTFKIREGIKFHNGDPLTSADVAFSVVRFSSKESTNPWSPYLRNSLESVETPDDYTFIYHAKKPEPPLVVPFAWTRILPKKYFEKVGQDGFRKAPIGSGPWKYGKFISKTTFEMLANEDYWRGPPAFAKAIDFMVPEESTRVAMLKRGDIDFAAGLSYDRIVELRDAGFRLVETGYRSGLANLFNISFQGTWMTDGPTQHKKFRQAMSYAINRQELCDTYFRGLGEPGGRWFMVESTWGWDPSWKADPYDPEKVKALLKEVGYPKKYKNPVINIFAQANQVEWMQAIAGYWEEAGIRTKITTVDPMTYGGYFFVRAKDPKAPNVGGIIPWGFGAVFNNVYHSANMFKSTGVHTTGNDPQADKMYDAAVAELNPDKAKKMWTEFMEYATNMYVNVAIAKVPDYVVVGPKLGEFTMNTHLSLYDALAGIKHK